MAKYITRGVGKKGIDAVLKAAGLGGLGAAGTAAAPFTGGMSLLLPLLGQLAGAGISGTGASQAVEDEQAQRDKELAEQSRQFGITTEIGKDQTNRAQNMEGLKFLTGQIANAQSMATRRTLRNKIFNSLAGV